MQMTLSDGSKKVSHSHVETVYRLRKLLVTMLVHLSPSRPAHEAVTAHLKICELADAVWQGREQVACHLQALQAAQVADGIR